MHSIAFLDRATLPPGVRRRRPGSKRCWTGFERSAPADLPERLAWASAQAQQALADRLIDNIDRFAKGTPVNVVHGAF